MSKILVDTGDAVDQVVIIQGRAPDAYDKFVQAAGNSLGLVGLIPGVRDAVESLLQELGDWFVKIETEIGEFVSNPGNTFKLWEYGNAWTTDVGGKASYWYEQMHPGSTGIDEEWKGSAAQAYTQGLLIQRNAFNSTKAAADDIDTALTEMSVAVGTFQLAIIGAVGPWIVEVTAEGVAALTGVALPPAFLAAIASCGKAFLLISGATAILEGVITGSLTSIKDLRQRLNNYEGSDKGNWPRFTKDLSDADITDGDVEWELTFDEPK
jgi:hypothetical protein